MDWVLGGAWSVFVSVNTRDGLHSIQGGYGVSFVGDNHGATEAG